jgi:uncharacterized membrane protein (DUF373 family)
VRLRDEFSAGCARWRLLTLYQKFERGIVLILTGLIAVVVIAAVWSLTLQVLFSLVLSDSFDPTEHAVFQAVFGMIFTVIIALEFKRSLLIVAEQSDSVIQLRSVLLIALLAIVRKFIILDLPATDALQLFGLSAGIIALGGVYWLIGEQDRHGRARRPALDG